jgi:hypothetical protein
VAVEPGVIVKDEWPLAFRLTVGCCGTAAVTVTLAVDGELLPPGPVQVNEYVTVPVLGKGPTDVPVLEGATVPVQASVPLPPEAVQEVALLVLHARDEDCPTGTLTGLAANEPMLAAGVALFTVTSTEAGALAPPGPVQLSVYTYKPAVLSGPMVVPALAVGRVPFQPSVPLPPLAVQALAPLLLQESTVEPPAVSVAGSAVKARMLAGGVAVVTVTVAELMALVPPLPVQLSVKV